tara:strand:- start:219 stop:440 length:222 start_codon:yes stop_codon:yes gene_type:complete
VFSLANIGEVLIKNTTKEKNDGLIYEIGNLFNNYEIGTIKLNKDKNVFRDLSHLNCRGDKLLTREHTTICVAE